MLRDRYGKELGLPELGFLLVCSSKGAIAQRIAPTGAQIGGIRFAIPPCALHRRHSGHPGAAAQGQKGA